MSPVSHRLRIVGLFCLIFFHGLGPVSANNQSIADTTKPAAGTEFKECAGCPEMVVIPVGSFLMGDETEEGYSDERPAYHVELKKPFSVSKYEVTQYSWKMIMGNNPSEFKDDSRPVDSVSWSDAQEYVARLNSKLGLEGKKRYRLLSEAEWEYVARAGSDTKFSCGNNADCLETIAWYNGNFNSSTHVVGSKSANRWGLYDLAGNVWEWVEDCFTENYSQASANGEAMKSAQCKKRVLRGGSFFDSDSRAFRPSHRNRFPKGIRSINIGFRVAKSL